ncbi:MAG: DUF1501 domain-containing protein [Myxococcales bacterium]|nr:DUF1501 domain-containing protein [Myxococcales bacterium]
MNRRQFLVSSAAAATMAPLGADAVLPPKNLVFVVAKGGWDTTWALDPKPDSPYVDGPTADPSVGERVHTENGIRFASNPERRPYVDGLFRRWGHRITVVNGIWMGSIVHHGCLNRILTGSRETDRPDLTVIHGFLHGSDLPLGNLDLSGISRPGPLGHGTGRVGFRHQLRMLLDHSDGFQGLDPDRIRPTRADRQDVQDYLARRMNAYAARRSGSPHDDRAASTFATSLRRAGALRDEGGPLTQSLTLGTAPDLHQNITLTLAALTRGICRSVVYEDQQVGWDSHPTNAVQGGLWNNLCQRLVQLLDGLDRHGILEETLVVVTSEMTRTPKLNGDGGKDHWPWTSAMVIGGGLPGGRVLGATDDRTLGLPLNLDDGQLDATGALCGYDNFAAGILSTLGIDPQPWLPGVEVLGALRA